MAAPAFYPRLLPSLALKLFGLIALLLLQVLIIPLPSIGKASSSTRPRAIISPIIDPATRSRISETYGKTPLSFQANLGQSHSKVKFLARGDGYDLFLTPIEAAMRLRIANRTRRNADSQPANYTPPDSQSAYIKMRLVGANTAPELSGLDPLPGACNYFIGAGAEKWREPFAYQEVNGARHQVATQYVLKGYGVGFRTGAYDKSKPLIIDPVLSYSTYFGASGSETGWAIAVDSEGNAYIAGQTSSTNFPTTPGAFQTMYGGGAADAFVLKLNPSGSALVYSTHLGGRGADLGFALALDSAGVAYVTGHTVSDRFPTVNAFQTNKGRQDFIGDAFVTAANRDGSALVYSSYLGGIGIDEAFAIAVDEAGAAYVTGRNNSVNFPTVNPLQAAFFGGSFELFITKVAPAESP